MHQDSQNKSDDINQCLIKELIENYGKDVLKIAYVYMKTRDLAEDVFQEVFIKVYNNLHDYHNINNVKGWICQIATNVCKDMKKSAWHKKIVLLDNYKDYEGESCVSEGLDIDFSRGSELNATIWTILKNMKDKYKEVLILYCIEEYSTKEIAKILNINESTVRARLRRARIEFKNLYERMQRKDESLS